MPTHQLSVVVISRKRRAQEPASSPRSYKQPRLIPQDQNPGLSQPPDKKETMWTKLRSLFRNSGHEKITPLPLPPVPSSPHLSTKDEISHEEYTVETTPVRSISPPRIQEQRHGSVRSTSSTSRNTFSTIEELSSNPFHAQGSASQSTPKGHNGPSSSITTTYSNTQPSSSHPVEHFLVEKFDNIQLDSSHSSLQSSQITSSSFSRGSTVQSKETYSIPRKTRVRPRSKPHIGHIRFKATVRERNREALKLRMYQVMKHHRELVHGRPVKGAMNFADYQLLLENLGVDKPLHMREFDSSARETQKTFITDSSSRFIRAKSPRTSRPYHESENGINRTLAKAKATLNSPKPSLPFVPSLDQRKIAERKKDADIERRLRGLPANLPPKEQEEVAGILRKRGVVAKFAREQVSDVDISRLNPGQWLNDEIVNFYGAMISARSQANKENAQDGKAGGNGSLDVHYFSTFFWAKLARDGYERGRLAKWTKKIDIFSKDIILIPINHSNAHWTAAAINFRKKRIESYDSMGVTKFVVFEYLRGYLDAEHKDKKKKPFDFTGWENSAPEDTPQQENGYDCGVFTCHFLEAISRGVGFAFTQQDMPYLRKRMIWEIGNGRLWCTNYK